MLGSFCSLILMIIMIMLALELERSHSDQTTQVVAPGRADGTDIKRIEESRYTSKESSAVALTK